MSSSYIIFKVSIARISRKYAKEGTKYVHLYDLVGFYFYVILLI